MQRTPAFAAILVCAALTFSHVPATAQTASAAPPLSATAKAGMPELKVLGGGQLRMFGFQVYNVYLWTPVGASFDRNKPYALDLQYLRTFSAKQLAERSIDEMRGQGIGSDTVYPKWLAEMERVFADVKDGDRLTGVVTATKSSKFFYNGAYRGEVVDPAFADAFFGIWLNEKSSQLRIRNLLLGKPE
ncbi:MAG: chalcone isomerase family protein [Rhizobacter sp.]|nr:chalcone isomerase family protein [Burkholderiales bacterium]